VMKPASWRNDPALFFHLSLNQQPRPFLPLIHQGRCHHQQALWHQSLGAVARLTTFASPRWKTASTRSLSGWHVRDMVWLRFARYFWRDYSILAQMLVIQWDCRCCPPCEKRVITATSIWVQICRIWKIIHFFFKAVYYHFTVWVLNLVYNQEPPHNLILNSSALFVI
jgi:hypothetical protein